MEKISIQTTDFHSSLLSIPIFEESHRTLNGLENSMFCWHLIDNRLKIQFKTEIPLHGIKYKYTTDVSTRNKHESYTSGGLLRFGLDQMNR